jgi:hypothetical protein
MTTDELTTIRQRWEKTAGLDWEVEWQNGKTYLMSGRTCLASFTLMSQRDCEFAAHAHQDVPRLLDEVERLQTEIARLTAVQEES